MRAVLTLLIFISASQDYVVHSQGKPGSFINVSWECSHITWLVYNTTLHVQLRHIATCITL